jgi:PPOX class probable F420-dependent enzyme
MSVAIPEKIMDLVERPIVAALATIMPSGAPQVTPVWMTYDGSHVIVNTARGRQKDRNMAPGSKVTLLLLDPQNPYHWGELRGTVEVETEEGAYEVIKDLALKYRGVREYPQNPGEVRVTYKIALEKVNGN